jgi:hypothetical protein
MIKKPGCALCWVDGIWSPPIKGWDGFPICREHAAESIAQATGQKFAVHEVEFSGQSSSLH